MEFVENWNLLFGMPLMYSFKLRGVLRFVIETILLEN